MVWLYRAAIDAAPTATPNYLQGDLVAFEGAGYSEAVNIKRVVGLPADTVEVWDGVLVVNGEAQEEPYVDYELTDATFSPRSSLHVRRIMRPRLTHWSVD